VVDDAQLKMRFVRESDGSVAAPSSRKMKEEVEARREEAEEEVEVLERHIVICLFFIYPLHK